MSAARFIAKVYAIHPAYDSRGEEYVCVEFGFKPPPIPSVLPAGVSPEISEMVKASKEVMKVVIPPQFQAQSQAYSNRLVLYLTLQEWDKLQEKYTSGDEFEVVVGLNGELSMREI